MSKPLDVVEWLLLVAEGDPDCVEGVAARKIISLQTVVDAARDAIDWHRKKCAMSGVLDDLSLAIRAHDGEV